MRTREPHRRLAGGARSTGGFTMVELLMTVAIISVATVVAWPALSTFMSSKGEAGTATSVARMINKVRDQARRRNRAYVMRFTGFSGNEPGGLMEILEGNGPSCNSVQVALAVNTRLIEAVPHGQTDMGAYVGYVEKMVGLSGWFAPEVDGLRDDVLELCSAPDGSITWRADGGVSQPIAGRLRIQVQRFEGEGDWHAEGPARGVEVTFAGGAQMAVR